MEKKKSLFMFLLLLQSFHASFAYGFAELHIDCGATIATPITSDGAIKWATDEQYIETGPTSKVVSSKNFSSMNTLRFLPIGNKSCYTLPTDYVGHKFLFRAGFYYGNYDGLNKPPRFDLMVDNNLWANVATSNDLVYYEIIYPTVRDNTSICLARTGEDIPIISSLEGVLVYRV